MSVAAPYGVPAARRPSGVVRLLLALAHALHGRARALAAHRRAAAERRAFAQLDNATLRDLGMVRSEYDSYWAEAHGDASVTRARVAQLLAARYGVGEPPGLAVSARSAKARP